MTIKRQFKQNDDFGNWLRNKQEIDSVNYGLRVDDIDWIFNKYKKNTDGFGERDVKLIMCVETKIYNGFPNYYQRETLFFMHQLLKKKQNLIGLDKKYAVWHFGFYVLSIPGTYPDERKMTWYIFDNVGNLIPNEIDENLLIKLLGFSNSPETFQKLSLRRHHKTSLLVNKIMLPMGIECDEIVKKRS